MIDRRHAIQVLLTASLLGASWLAGALPPARGKVILTVIGSIAERNAGEQAQLDLDMIESLPQRTFTTMTPWSAQAIRFSGPLMRDLLAYLKASGTQIAAYALNDYKVLIPAEDARRYDLILATRIDGKPIPVRTRGPLFVVYPFDGHPELQSSRYHERSIWQLKALEIH